MATRNIPEFNLQAEIDAIDRRRAVLNQKLDHLASRSDRLWLWSFAFVVPVAVGVLLALVL